jgi:CelD/BcsL family acetyltransferase involved in cellulose biosynthesis
VIGQPEVLTDLTSVESLLPEWRALAASSARAALDAPDWLLPLARRYLSHYGVRFLVWRQEGELVGVAPLSLIADRPPGRPLRQLAFWGTIGPRMRGLVDIVAHAAVRNDVVDSFAEWLRANPSWDLVRIVRPQVGSATPDRLRREARVAGWRYAPYSNLRSTTFQLDLPASEEGWAKHLGSKSRKVMRWEMRKFAEFRGGAVDHAVAQEAIPEALDAVERMLRDRWGDGEVYFANDHEFRGLVHESVPALAEQGSAWVTVARDDAGIQGVLVSLAENGHGMALLIAMTTDPAYKSFSLGKHLFDAGLAEAVRRGCSDYDFLWVGGYKEDFWHAEPRFLESAMVGRGFVGRLAARVLARRA